MSVFIVAIPLNKSDSVSNPSIAAPGVKVENGKVIIQFDSHFPRYYTYKIERYDYATHTTVYEGEYLPTFTDENISDGKKYIYTVTPIYKDNVGKTISLPSVSTAQGTHPPPEETPILGKEWWEY